MILVTGATGFVGRKLISDLLTNGYQVNALVRQVSQVLPVEVEQIIGDLQDLVVDNLSPLPEVYSRKVDRLLKAKLTRIDVLIHCAARVHIMNDLSEDPVTDFREMNRYSTLALARMAADAGVSRFIFLSSIKVNGETTRFNESFTEKDIFVPDDPYGVSKYEAEQGLLALAEETGMEVVIIRLPLVYGPGVRANFASLIKWVNRGVPLPFGAIHNKRSLVALDNLISFIIHCIDHPKAANEVFLISDGEDVSTTELLQRVAKAFGKRCLLIPVPVWLMTSVAKCLGKAGIADRLFSSLVVDSSKASDLLGWKPVVTMDQQLKRIVYYLNK